MSRASMIVLADYEGKVIPFRDDGWFNMTKVANQFGKRLQDFLDNKETKKYMVALARAIHANERDLIQARRGRQGGTWAHPKLAIRFARWLSEDFEVWCDLQIEQILKGGSAVDLSIERTLWRQRLELEVDEAKNFAVASMSGRILCSRKRWLPKYRRRLEELRLQMEPTLFRLGA